MSAAIHRLLTAPASPRSISQAVAIAAVGALVLFAMIVLCGAVLVLADVVR
jgi:hypothetical protein